MRFSLPLFVGLLLSLTACAVGGPRRQAEGELRHAAHPETLTVQMALRVLPPAQGRRVGIVVLNPQGIPIQSVRAWVHYDPAQLVVGDLVMEDGRFTLFAPGERTIDESVGMVKLGAAVGSPLTDRELLVASFAVRELRGVKGDHPILSFYDWRAEGDGHTAILTIRERAAQHILKLPSSLAL